jgi:hypothetical protein
MRLTDDQKKRVREIIKHHKPVTHAEGKVRAEMDPLFRLAMFILGMRIESPKERSRLAYYSNARGDGGRCLGCSSWRSSHDSTHHMVCSAVTQRIEKGFTTTDAASKAVAGPKKVDARIAKLRDFVWQLECERARLDEQIRGARAKLELEEKKVRAW